MQHLKKTGGGGVPLAHPTRMCILSDHREPKDSSPASLFSTPVYQSGNCSQDTAPKGHFFRPLLSTASTLFQVPYPVTPLLGTHTKTAGCVPTIPILERFQQGCCKWPYVSALPLRTLRLCVILFLSSLLNFQL